MSIAICCHSRCCHSRRESAFAVAPEIRPGLTVCGKTSTPEGHPFTGAIKSTTSHSILSGVPHSLTVRGIDEGPPQNSPQHRSTGFADIQNQLKAFAVVPETGPGFSPDIQGPPQNRALALGTCSLAICRYPRKESVFPAAAPKTRFKGGSV
jgi:hypothetical protein